MAVKGQPNAARKFGIEKREKFTRTRFEKYADLFFMFGLIVLSMCAILLGFEVVYRNI